MRRSTNTSMLQADKAAKESEKVQVREKAGLKYVLEENDLVLKSGRFVDKRISELVKTVEGRDYVGELWENAPNEMRDVIRRFFST
jgi:hypothetical protein